MLPGLIERVILIWLVALLLNGCQTRVPVFEHAQLAFEPPAEWQAQGQTQDSGSWVKDEGRFTLSLQDFLGERLTKLRAIEQDKRLDAVFLPAIQAVSTNPKFSEVTDTEVAEVTLGSQPARQFTFVATTDGKRLKRRWLFAFHPQRDDRLVVLRWRAPEEGFATVDSTWQAVLKSWKWNHEG